MSNKNNKIRLDIKQWQGPLISIFLISQSNNKQEIHVEDIAIHCKEMFPSFFGWSKHKEMIDLRQVMRTMDKLKLDGLIEGSNITLWSLTLKGYKYASKLVEFDISKSSKDHRMNHDIYSREINRIHSTAAFHKFMNNQTDKIEPSELKYLFRIDSYNKDPESINKNKQRLLIATLNNDDLAIFVNEMISLLKKLELD